MHRSITFVLSILVASCVDGDESELTPSQVQIAIASESQYHRFDQIDSGDLRFRVTEPSIFITCWDDECSRGAPQVLSTIDPPNRAAERTSRLVSMQVGDMLSAESNIARVLDESRRRDDSSTMLVHLWLWEDDYDFAELRSARSTIQREAIIQARRVAIHEAQVPVVQAVAELGGEVIAQDWLTNSLAVAVPSRRVAELIHHPLVHSAYLDDAGTDGAAGDGLERRDAFESSTITQTGETGGLGGGQVTVGVVELATNLNNAHLGWRDSGAPGSPSRVLSAVVCTTASCSGAATTTAATHGTTVASVVAGSIQQTQDAANFPGTFTAEQQRRSGLLREGEIRYYRAQGAFAGEAGKAVETAVADGVDVLNFSHRFPTGCTNLCDASYNPAGIKAKYAAAEEAGVILVAMAGNQDNKGCPPGCTTTFPGFVASVISVGGLDDTTGEVSFDQAGIAAFSGRGSINATHPSGAFTPVPTVDLVGFGFVQLAFDANTTYTAMDSGNSFSTPQVSSLAALFRQYTSDQGIGLGDAAWGIAINLLLMGDGMTGPNTSAVDRVDGTFGFGFPRYFVPVASHFGNGGGWGMGIGTISQGQTLAWTVGDSGPESSSVNGWKWVLAVDTEYEDVPDLNVRVVDTCNSNAIVKSAQRQATRFRIRLSKPEITGKCLQMRVTGDVVKAGGETFWSADYFWTNSSSNHVYP